MNGNMLVQLKAGYEATSGKVEAVMSANTICCPIMGESELSLALPIVQTENDAGVDFLSAAYRGPALHFCGIAAFLCCFVSEWEYLTIYVLFYSNNVAESMKLLYILTISQYYIFYHESCHVCIL